MTNTRTVAPIDRIRQFIGHMGSRWVRDYNADGFGTSVSPLVEKHILPSGEAVLIESIPGQTDGDLTGVEVYAALTTSARLDVTEAALSKLAAGVREHPAPTTPALILDESIADVAMALMHHYQRLGSQNQMEAEKYLKHTHADPRGVDPNAGHWLKLAQGHIEQARTYLDRAEQFRSIAGERGTSTTTLGGVDRSTDHGDRD